MLQRRFITYFYIAIALAVFSPGLDPLPVVASEKSAPMPEEDFQVLASGPIHEAFAEAVTLDPDPGLLAPKAPPVVIEEIPPDQKPEGDVQWIPGYWAWDDERDDYIWVSGIWRVPPPGRQWVPGYWSSVNQDYQWISGYWASVMANETEYLPEPPESVEVGPSSNAPSQNYTWIPGSWVWQGGRYAWRPGYWAVVDPNWIWLPAHYNWTPRGYIFVGGYWDYPVIHRGVLFAPIFFPRAHLGLTFAFSPGFVIDLNIFNDALFLRPRYSHYYYGDYYSSNDYRRGIYPWFSLHARRVAYDPIYAHQRWNHRKDRKWENNLQTKFRERREHEELRPLRSFDQRTGPEKSGKSSGSARPNFVMPIDQAGKTKGAAYRFKALSEKDRNGFKQQEKEVRTYQKERQSRETRRDGLRTEKTLQKSEPDKEKFSKSPIMDRSSQKTDRKKAPPAQLKAPKPDPNVEPLQRGKDLSRSSDKSQKPEKKEQKSEASGQQSMGKDQKSGDGRERSEDSRQKSDDGKQRGNEGQKRSDER